MNKIIGLPKNAEIHTEYNALYVEDFRVLNKHGLLEFLICTLKLKDTNNVVSQMKAQGFRFAVVIEQCIEDVGNPAKFGEAMIWDYHEHMKRSNMQEFESAIRAKGIAVLVIKKLNVCKNWDDLIRMLHTGSKFRKEMNKRITEAVKLCIR